MNRNVSILLLLTILSTPALYSCQFKPLSDEEAERLETEGRIVRLNGELEDLKWRAIITRNAPGPFSWQRKKIRQAREKHESENYFLDWAPFQENDNEHPAELKLLKWDKKSELKILQEKRNRLNKQQEE